MPRRESRPPFVVMRTVRHVIAESMGEVCRVNARISPAANPVCDSKGHRIAFPDPTNEERILATGWPLCHRTGVLRILRLWLAGSRPVEVVYALVR